MKKTPLIIPAEAWSIPIGEDFPKKDYPDISFRVPWEQLQMTRDGARQGCPVGGMGAGSIGRTYYGDFARWQIVPYEHIYDNEVYGSQFHLFVNPFGAKPFGAKPSGAKPSGAKPSGAKPFGPPVNSGKPFAQTLMAGSPADATRASLKNVLSTWPWNYPTGKGTYSALFPKAWCDYTPHPDNPVSVVLEQFSPVIPHDYHSSALPVALYTWHIHNPLEVPVEAAVLFTFENMAGRTPESKDRTRDMGGYSESRWSLEPPEIRQFHRVVEDDESLGIRLSPHPDDLEKLPLSRRGEFAVAVEKGGNITTGRILSFDCRGDGREAQGFFKQGKLPGGPADFVGSPGTFNGAGVSGSITLPPGGSGEIRMTLAWDFPEIKIYEPGGRAFRRKYTEYKPDAEGQDQDIDALQIAREGLLKRTEWSARIDAWHDEVRADVGGDPLLVKSVLNEQYYLLDGGTMWEALTNNFGFLESIDYFNYETLDVRFYYSFTLLRFWPELEERVMTLFSEAIAKEDTRLVPWKYGYDYGCQSPEDIKEDIRLVKGACPHDLGRPMLGEVTDPEKAEDPFVELNAYSHRNVNFWKDLNTKFVLMVYRNYYLGLERDPAVLRRHWDSSVEAMEYLQKYDTNGDFIPENSGFPDQTYDTAWHMLGLSAYCGGLWLAAVAAMVEMAGVLGKTEAADKYRLWFDTGKKSFHKTLWNGEYYDCYEGCSDVMADQLAGQWYADLLGLPPIDGPEFIEEAYRSIYKYSFLGYFNGKRGVVTGITTEGVVPDEEQTPEVWVAINYTLGSAFMMRGLNKEGMEIIRSVHELVWKESGLWWSTPEALSLEEVPEERVQRAYEFARRVRGKDWVAPEGYRPEDFKERLIPQMRAPQYSRPMASSALLYSAGHCKRGKVGKGT